MTYNLIEEAWIPTRDVDGNVRHVAPFEITDDRLRQISAPRPDFSAAVAQWLIGVVQTVATPGDLHEWVDLYEEPPSSQQLKQDLARAAHAFDLFGEGKRFMQDPEAADGKRLPVMDLLVETPTGQTLKRNADLFIKRRLEGTLCRPCAAMALFTLQANAPEGGSGHFTSLRGGGPITTLVLGDTLWGTIWNNVLPKQTLKRLKGDPSKNEPHETFPWLGPVRKGGKGGQPTTPRHGHPLMVYWATPRRLWFGPAEAEGICFVCGSSGTDQVSSYTTAANGFQYQGWVHPLTPYRQDRDSMVSLKGGPGGMTYRNWLGWVQEDKDQNRIPALTVTAFREEKIHDLDSKEVRMWCTGFWTKQNAILHWQESTMPIRSVPEEHLEQFEGVCRRMVRGAEAMRWALDSCAREAMFRRPQDIRGDMGYLSTAYWSRTEPSFYEHQNRILESSIDEQTEQTAMEQWHRALVTDGRALFVHYAQGGQFSDADPERVSKAYVRMNRTFFSKKVRKEFNLAPKRIDPTQITLPEPEEVPHATTI